MRKTKRFTPTVISRFKREGRGEGTHAQYVPWHKVSRGDPSSRGRSHLLMWRSRLRELLSDGELVEQLFATMLPNVDDSLEQYPLSITDEWSHPACRYDPRPTSRSFSGTLSIAENLGIKHPRLKQGANEEAWILTTDLVLVLQTASGQRELLALAFKPADWSASKRTRELLKIEREYWTLRKVEWLLITPELYSQSAALTLLCTRCWALGPEIDRDRRTRTADLARSMRHLNVTQLLGAMSVEFGSLEIAQRALWQAIWFGALHVDLSRGWRPQNPLTHIGAAEFLAQNPIYSRRSAWI